MRLATLKNKIIIILTAFTIINIAVFIAVQLNYEARRVNKFIQSKANVVVFNLENIWGLLETLGEAVNVIFPEQKKIEFLEKNIIPLADSKEILGAYILDKEGKIVFSTPGPALDYSNDFYDAKIVSQIKEGTLSAIKIHLDVPSKTFFSYVPLSSRGAINYVIRVFFPLKDVWDIYQQVYQPAITIGLLFIAVNIILGILFSRLVLGPIKVFNDASKVIASGELSLKVNMPTNDELAQMADTFNFMTQELIKMKERAENANPLTKLPGNIVIMEEVEKRIKSDKTFTVIYSDLDNFKAFNDKYGIHRGDEAIKLNADILKAAIKNKGTPEDFIGHEGGDDFIILTTPQNSGGIADYIITEFDKRIKMFYEKEDLERGYILATGRDGSTKQFPIMTISLAGVTNMVRRIESYAEVTHIAAELKKKAKQEYRSCFIADKRND
jgi:diguanylate cyclase (GGDEF)-like protein